MTNVMRLRNTLQADYNEAVVSDFDADLFLALDLALGMIEELQARVGALEDAAKSTPKQATVTIDKAAFDEAITTLREAWEEAPTGPDIPIDTAIRLLTEH